MNMKENFEKTREYAQALADDFRLAAYSKAEEVKAKYREYAASNPNPVSFEQWLTEVL